MENKWLVFNVGCLSCGVSSNVVGIFDNEEEANNVANKLDDTLKWRGDGENSFQVFHLPAIGVISEEYIEALGLNAKKE